MDMGFVNAWRRRSQESSFNHGGDKEELFLRYCDLVENGSIEPSNTDPMDVVDNFYVNGDFVRREDCDSEREWRHACRCAICHTDEMAILHF